jgi:predicted patatin/cPLA2 family phospholipase
MPVKKIIKAVLPGRAGNPPGGQATKRVNLALQGGGAHGAFTWGVLEHLLSDDRRTIAEICWPALLGSTPMLPDATCAFCALIALATSSAVRLKPTNRFGSIQTRTARSVE